MFAIKLNNYYPLVNKDNHRPTALVPISDSTKRKNSEQKNDITRLPKIR